MSRIARPTSLQRPRVSVILAVHNDLQYLQQAVDSVLTQTLGDLELIAVDDGSTDGSGELLGRTDDPRLRILRNEANLGLAASLNRALGCARGQYIARMDADDVSEPTRLQAQADFLDAHPSVGIVGTSRRLINESGDEVGLALAVESDAAIRCKLLLGNPFAHPTVMLRAEVLDAHRLRYDESFRTAQDYELWTRLLRHTEGANLPEPLVRYRLRDGISRLHKTDQLANHDRIAHQACGNLLPEFGLTLEDVRQLRGRFGGFSVRDAGMDATKGEWVRLYEKMKRAIQERPTLISAA